MRTFNACCEGLFQLDHKASITQLLKHAELPWWFHVVALYKEGRLSPKHDQNQKSSHRMKRGNTTKTVPFLCMRWIETRCLCPDFGLILRLTGHLNILAAVWASGPTCLNPPPVMNLAPRIFWSQYSYDLLWSLMSCNIWCHSDVTVPRLCRDVQAILHLRSDVAIFTRPPYHNIISVLESEPRPASTRVWPSVECDDQSKPTQKSSEIHVHPRAMIWVWAEIGPL